MSSKPYECDPADRAVQDERSTGRQADRSQQRMVGPSELGSDCDRQLAYRIAGMPPVNHPDQWPATVGTAIHQWLEATINEYQREHGLSRWLTETTVLIDNLIPGHIDLFDTQEHAVWDFKTTNTDKIRQFRQNGAPENYRKQTHLYGLGMSQSGRRVDRVGLIVLPRSGWLSSAWVWSERYDEALAREALSRMYSLGERVLELGVDQHPEQIRAIEATPSKLCSWCNFYSPQGDSYGCPAK